MDHLKFVALTDIELITNYRDIEPVTETDIDVIDLSKNIQKMGILQPVLVRPHYDGPQEHAGKYQLIFGHRRFIACRLAGLTEIPCSIKAVANQDILEIQVTENLQRKDVHPLDEAAAFRAYMEEKKIDIEELAAKFGKSTLYIAQRLSFNALIPELKKDFKAGILLIGHAILLSRLQPADQKTIMQSCRNTYYKKEQPFYEPVEEMRDTIESEIMHELTHVGFDKKDPKLVAKAGACIDCQKRSGAGLLFADIKEKDRCFDGACYNAKEKAHLLRAIDDLIASPDPVPVVANSGGSLDKDIKKKLSDNKIVLLEEYTDYNEATKKTPGAVMALSINGSKAGRLIAVTLKSSHKGKAEKSKGVTKAAGKRAANDIDLEIGGIQDRQKRALQLDLEKVHKFTLEKLEKCQEVKKPGLGHQGLVDRGIMIFLLFTKAAGYSAKDVIRKNLKNFPKAPPYNPHMYLPDYIKKMAELTDDDIAFMIRAICLDHFGNKNLVNSIDEEDTTLRLIAEYAGIDLKSIEEAQAVESTKRIERAQKRIKALQAEKTQLQPPRGNKKSKQSKQAEPKVDTAPDSEDIDDEDFEPGEDE